MTILRFHQNNVPWKWNMVSDGRVWKREMVREFVKGLAPPSHPRNIEPGMNSPFGCGAEPIPGPILPARAITYKHTQLYLSNAGVSPSWTNTFCNSKKYIWQFGQIHLACQPKPKPRNIPRSILLFQEPILPVWCTLHFLQTPLTQNPIPTVHWPQMEAMQKHFWKACAFFPFKFCF